MCDWRFNDPRHYKLAKLINSGRKMNITELGKETDLVLSHLSIVFNQWFQEGIIVRRKEGQDTYVMLTDFGKEIFKAYDSWAKLANKANENHESFMETQ